MCRTGIAASTSVVLLALVLAGCGAGRAQLRSPDGDVAGCALWRCVSSLAENEGDRVEPIRYSGSPDAARAALARVLASMEGARLVLQTADYMHVEFTSRRLRYVDDLELIFPPGERLVHVRSSSRLGLYDLGKNRERVEDLRARFEALQP